MLPSMAGPTRHKTDLGDSSQDYRPHKDRVYVHFADDKMRPADDPNLRYTDETNAYTTISTRGHFTPNPRAINHNTTPSGNTWSHDLRHALEDPISDRSVKGDFPRSQERGQDVSIPLSARSYELSPSRRLQPSPKQSQGPLADKLGPGDDISNKREMPTHDSFANSTKMVSVVLIVAWVRCIQKPCCFYSQIPSSNVFLHKHFSNKYE